MRVVGYAVLWAVSTAGASLTGLIPLAGGPALAQAGSAQAGTGGGTIEDRWPDATMPRREGSPAEPARPTPAPVRAPEPPLRTPEAPSAAQAPAARPPVETAEERPSSTRASRRAARQATPAIARAEPDRRSVRRTARATATPSRRVAVPQPSFRPRLLTLQARDRAAIYRALAETDPTFGSARAQSTGTAIEPGVSPGSAGRPSIVGMRLGSSIRVSGLPVVLAAKLPALKAYGYALVEGRLLIVDPATGVVVADATL